MTARLKTQFRERLSQDLVERSIPGIAVYIALWSIIIFTTGFHRAQPEMAYPYWLAFLVCSILRLAYQASHHHLFRFSPPLDSLFFNTTVMLPAALWGGLYTYFIVQPAHTTMKLLMVITTAGLCSGGVSSYAPHRLLAVTYMLIVTVPACIGLFFLRPQEMPLIYLMVTYLGFTVLLLLRANREYWTALVNEAALAEKSRQLEGMARTDGLTGIYNRRYFNRMLALEWKRGFREKRPLTLIMLDIDHFKRINDDFGHLAGDDYLKGIAGILTTSFKRCTDITARYGGEEFVILLPGTPLEDAALLAESLRQEIAAHRLKSGEAFLKATVSLGVASSVPDYLTPAENLMSRADQALYEAKKGGRNQVRLAADAPARLAGPHLTPIKTSSSDQQSTPQAKAV